MQTGIIGLGVMGKPIAQHLHKGCDELIAFGQDKDVLHELQDQGICIADDVQEMVASDLLFLCLPNAQVVWDVLFGQEGIADGLKAGTTVVDTSTISHMKTIEIADELEKRGIFFIDAPISGMARKAEEGTLTVMCGGKIDVFKRVKHFLDMFGSEILYMGQVGSGQLTKLINQLLFDIHAAALAEILPLSVKMGLDSEQVCKVINNGTGRSYASEFFVPRILQGDFSGGYPLQSAYKDLVSGAEISAHHKIPLPVLAAATATYQQALLRGLGGLDKGGMVRVYEDLLDVKFRSAASL